MRASVLGVLAFLLLGSGVAHADGLDWRSIVGRIAKEAIRGGIEGGVEGGSKEAARTGAMAGALGQTVVEGIDAALKSYQGVSDPYTSQGIQELRSSLDANMTWSEYDAVLAQINATMAAHEARVADLENRVAQSTLSITDLDNRTEKNFLSIGGLREQQRRLREQFDESLKDLDFQIARIKGKQVELEEEIRNEAMERQGADALLQSQLDVHTDDISKLYSLISPDTRGTTAARLASSGAIELLRGSDLTDVIRTLQLSLAYDKISEKHVDPGVRYYLAVAYRRAGKTHQAEEMLIEAVTAERFRETANWFYRIHYRFQGDDRLWVDSFRRDPRFGVRAPRDVVIYTDKKVKSPTTVAQ